MRETVMNYGATAARGNSQFHCPQLLDNLSFEVDRIRCLSGDQALETIDQGCHLSV